MTALMTDMYVHIVDFADKAVRWYSGSKLKHAITAFTHPYVLHFKDTVDNILEISRRIDRMALTLSMSELRQVKLELQELRKEHHETQNLALEMRKAIDGKSSYLKKRLAIL